MKIVSIIFILFGITIIVYPQLLAYLIGWFFIVLGLNLLVWYLIFQSKFKKAKKDYAEFMWYKIYKG